MFICPLLIFTFYHPLHVVAPRARLYKVTLSTSPPYFSHLLTSPPFSTSTSLSPGAGTMRSVPLSAYIPLTRLAIWRFATPRSHEAIVRHLSVSPNEAITEDARRRIYFDNAGAQGILFAFFLRRAGLPVNLLVRRQRRLEKFERACRKWVSSNQSMA